MERRGAGSTVVCAVLCMALQSVMMVLGVIVAAVMMVVVVLVMVVVVFSKAIHIITITIHNSK